MNDRPDPFDESPAPGERPDADGDAGGDGDADRAGSDAEARDAEAGLFTQQASMNHVTARVPESVAGGVFSTGAIVMLGGTEFAIDFVQRLRPPHQVVARVIMPFATLPRFIAALEENLGRFRQTFGEPPAMPRAPEGQRADPPPVSEIYDQLKLSDEVAAGAYANTVLIGHSPAEFSFDFVNHLYPHASVVRRVFLAAPHVAPLLASLKSNHDRLRRRGGPPSDLPPGSPAD
jgi:hypothetical protein